MRGSGPQHPHVHHVCVGEVDVAEALLAVADGLAARRGARALAHDRVRVARIGTRVRRAEVVQRQVDALTFLSLQRYNGSCHVCRTPPTPVANSSTVERKSLSPPVLVVAHLDDPGAIGGPGVGFLGDDAGDVAARPGEADPVRTAAPHGPKRVHCSSGTTC